MSNSDALLRRGLWLEYSTLGWNVVGTGVVMVAAFQAHSIALAGFGLDSLVEIAASVVVVWQLRALHERRERPALRCISVSFFALSIYVLLQSARALLLQARPGPSPLGAAWLALTCVAMLLLAAGKDATGKALNNPVLTTEARVTLIDALLAGAVLLGLGLNAQFGWWWADPCAGLVIVFYGFREGRQAWREAESAAAHVPKS